MSLLLDTNVCIAYLHRGEQDVVRRMRVHAPRDVCLCSVVKAELIYGARNSDHVEANLRRLHDFFEPIDSHGFDDDAADHYGMIRAQLRRAGALIGGNDLMIAAIALARDLTLVTRNQDEFRRVPGLRIASW